MTTYLLCNDPTRADCFQVIQGGDGGLRIVGYVERLRPHDWILAGPWAPAPEFNLRDYDAPAALLAGCRRAGLDVAALEPKDQESILLRADALGYQRMDRYYPNAAIAANE